ncbi:hypothetical protein [Streptomyces coeruleorubidus]
MLGEGAGAADVAADETEGHGQAEAGGAFDAGGGAAHAEPQRQLLLQGAGRDREVVERRAVAARPGDMFAVVADGEQEIQLLGKDVVVVGGVDPEESEGFEEGARPAMISARPLLRWSRKAKSWGAGGLGRGWIKRIRRW